MSEAADAKESWEGAVRRRVADVRKRWPSLAPDPVPLDAAHQLLEDLAVENAVRRAAAMSGYVIDLREPSRMVASDNFDEYLIPEPGDPLPSLQTEVWHALREGKLIARGLNPDNVVRGKLVVISSDRWSVLTPDFEHSAATFDGKTMAVGITVVVASSKKITIERTNWSRSEIQKWYFEERLPAIPTDRQMNLSRLPKDQRDLDFEAAQSRFPGFTDRDWFRAMRKTAGISNRGRRRTKTGK